MGAESGVYTIEEAIKAGLYTPPEIGSTIKVIEEAKRHDMFNICQGVSDIGYTRLRQLREVYQNEINIDNALCADYIRQINDVRSTINRHLDEIERLFKECCTEHLVEKTLNNA